MSLINHDKLQKFVSHDPTLLPTLCDSVRELLPEALSDLQDGIDASDPAQISIALHTIKGRFGYFFCDEPTKFAQAADTRARSGDIGAIESVARCLNDYTKRLLDEIELLTDSNS